MHAWSEADSLQLCSVRLSGLQSRYVRQLPNKLQISSLSQSMDIIKHRELVYPAGSNSVLMAFCRVWQLLFVYNDTRWSSLASGGATTLPQLCPVGFCWKFIIVSNIVSSPRLLRFLLVVVLLTVYVESLKLWGIKTCIFWEDFLKADQTDFFIVCS